MTLSDKGLLEKINIKLNQFIYNYEYQILIISSILCGFLIIFITNKFYIHTRLYYFLFFFGILVSFLGFTLEFVIKYFKKKAIETSFNYFLQDLSREYKLTQNISVALVNITKTNTYGSIDTEIKRIATRVSWGADFEDALYSVNKEIKSSVINHTLILLKTFKDSNIPLNRILLNISKDLVVFKEESQKKKYFLNLYYLSIVLFFIFLIVILFINIIVGNNFLWYGSSDIINRIFFDNFLLFISILLAIFISFIMFSIKEEKGYDFVKYIFIYFIIIILIFQVVVPKPDAEHVLIDSITYMNKNEINSVKTNNVVALKSINADFILNQTYSDSIYFLPFNKKECGVECSEKIIFISDATFLNFEIIKEDINFVILYEYN
jgi:hypothetical protein